MAASSKKTFVVSKADGKEVTVTGTSAEEDPNSSAVRIFDGDDIVASFRGYSSFYVEGSSS